MVWVPFVHQLPPLGALHAVVLTDGSQSSRVVHAELLVRGWQVWHAVAGFAAPDG